MNEKITMNKAENNEKSYYEIITYQVMMSGCTKIS